MHAFVGVKAACGGAVAGIDADERIRVGLLNGIPAFFGDVNGVGGSRVQNDAPSVPVRDLRIVGPGNQGKLVPAFYSGGKFIEKTVGAFGIVDVPHIFPDAFPAQQTVIRGLVCHYYVLFPGNGFPVILQGNRHVGRAHGAPAAQACADGFHCRGEKQGCLDCSRVYAHH